MNPDTVVQTSMIGGVSVEDVRNCANYTHRGVIVLAGAAVPCARVLDMDLATGVVVAQETTRQNGYRVLFVRDPDKASAIRE